MGRRCGLGTYAAIFLIISREKRPDKKTFFVSFYYMILAIDPSQSLLLA